MTTYYHKFDDHWRLSFEFYDEHQNGVSNISNPTIASGLAAGTISTPFLQANSTSRHCASYTVVRSNANAIGSAAYLVYSPDPLNNFSLRPEIGYYKSKGANAFNNGTRNFTLIGASDIIWHF